MNRRSFSKLVGLGAAAFSTRLTVSPLLNRGETPTLYYIDGYHGGVKGHMPPGSWRDVLNTMRAVPTWKLGLEIEPASWDVLRREDPQAYRELKAYLDEQPIDARVEMLSVTFAQPYGWAIGGESNIRQLVRAIEITREHFPEAVLETYAVQEPCWASCLPQILKSLGFTGAVLKNPATAWGGYAAGLFNADLVKWTGPDGSSIPAAPRYACEGLLNAWQTESVNGSADFARECVANGISHPAGMCFQDLGWSAKPWVTGDHIQHVTWREYIHTVADKPTQSWDFETEDILVTLPWGEQTLQAVAQQVRSAETRLLMAEKVGAMAWLQRGSEWLGEDLREAWDDLMWAQHHDAWITATTRSGRRAWAFLVAAETLDAEQTANAVIGRYAEALSMGQLREGDGPLESQWVRVINTLGTERSDLAELTFATDRGTMGVRVLDAAGDEIPSQIIPRRQYDPLKLVDDTSISGEGLPTDVQPYKEESLNTVSVLFRPTTPALGYASYRIEPLFDDEPKAQRASTSARAQSDGTVILESDLYRLQIDPARGGAVTSLLVKQSGRELIDPTAERLFNEYRGYFISQERWRSSIEQPAEVTIVESGPVRARVRVAGDVGGVPYQTTISLVEGQRRIDFLAHFVYEEETWIGDPWDIKPEERRTQRRRSQNDGRWKLQAYFPVSVGNQTVYKNAAYDVCRSRNTDTFFQGWDEIKHNIILDWVDVLDEQSGDGLAVFSDHTTAYTHGPDHPLALVLGWGWEGGFWWGKRPLEGMSQISYAVVPHSGRWDSARLSEENNRWKEAPLAQIMAGQPREGNEARSFISVGDGIEVPTVLVDGRNMLVRLFNAEGTDSEHVVSFHTKPSRVEVMELDGRTVSLLDILPAAEGRHQVRIPIPRFGIRTLRVELPGSTDQS